MARAILFERVQLRGSQTLESYPHVCLYLAFPTLVDFQQTIHPALFVALLLSHLLS